MVVKNIYEHKDFGNNFKISVINIENLEEGKGYVLLSRTFYDEEAEMYANPVDFLEATFPDYEERPEEEVIDYLVKAISERQPITDYNVFQINDDLDTVTAERVGFGVLQMLTGSTKDNVLPIRQALTVLFSLSYTGYLYLAKFQKSIFICC